MKTLAILSQKGGTGKTTLVLHLAVAAERAGRAVAVLDLDPQGSATGWKNSRDLPTPTVVALQANDLAKTLAATAEHGTTLVLLDTAPHSGDAAMAAAAAADLILVPCRAGILDLRAIATTAEIARLAGKPAAVVINHAPHRAPRLIDDAAEAVRHHGLDLAPVVVHQRSAFGHALTVGLTAGEYEPGGKADAEIEALLAWVLGRLET